MTPDGATTDLTTAQLVAQPAAQPTEATSTNMSAQPSQAAELNAADLPDTTAMVSRVMTRHAINADRLAAVLDRDKGTVSRILSGNIAVPYTLVLWLWRSTGDHEIAEHMGLGAGRVTLHPANNTGPRRLVTAIMEAEYAMGQLTQGMLAAAYPEQRPQRPVDLDMRIDHAISALLTLRQSRQHARAAELQDFAYSHTGKGQLERAAAARPPEFRAHGDARDARPVAPAPAPGTPIDLQG